MLARDTVGEGSCCVLHAAASYYVALGQPNLTRQTLVDEGKAEPEEPDGDGEGGDGGEGREH